MAWLRGPVLDAGTISAEDLELVQVVDDPREAVAVVRERDAQLQAEQASGPRAGLRPVLRGRGDGRGAPVSEAYGVPRRGAPLWLRGRPVGEGRPAVMAVVNRTPDSFYPGCALGGHRPGGRAGRGRGR